MFKGLQIPERPNFASFFAQVWFLESLRPCTEFQILFEDFQIPEGPKFAFVFAQVWFGESLRATLSGWLCGVSNYV